MGHAGQNFAGATDGLFDDRPPVDALAALPKAGGGGGGGFGPLGEGIGGATGAGGFTAGSGRGSGSGGRGRGGPLGGCARTSLYGIEADGYKFIYVFDRSGSMGIGDMLLSSAKANLLASLESLGDTHQFQIIFDNEKPTIFALAGHPDRLVFGTSANCATAQQFVRGIVADGGTRHEEALWMVLKMQPDDPSSPTPAPAGVVACPVRENSSCRPRCSINTIEFADWARKSRTITSSCTILARKQLQVHVCRRLESLAPIHSSIPRRRT